jgi:regulator of sirC expression with transglutaminase-like and TPR domain
MESAARFAELIAAGTGNLDEICALIGCVIDPSVGPDETPRLLDGVAAKCPPTFEGILQTLFASDMFTGDVEQYDALDNSLLHSVLTRGMGMPITLSVVAIEVGRRLGVGIYGIGLPGHFVIRDARSELYADPYSGGLVYDRAGMSAAWVERLGKIHPPPASAFQPVTNRAIALRILNNVKESLLNFGAPPAAWVGFVKLRSAFAELAGEQPEWRQMMSRWN